MNILFTVPYVPTPIRTRPYHLLRGLARRGHHVTLATLWENPAERAALGEWEDLGLRVLAQPLPAARKLANLAMALPTRTPLQARYCWQPALARLLAEAAANAAAFDALHVEHLRGAPYALELNHLGRRVVWDAVDCISLLFEKAAVHSRSFFGRWVTRFDLARTRRYEGWLVGQFARVLVTAAADRQALVALAGMPAPEIDVLPNGVDLEHFCPGQEARMPGTILLSGKMSYHANISAALFLVQEIMPRVWAADPSARVQLVGANPPAALRDLARKYPGRVEVTGTVPDIVPYLQRAAVAVTPMPYGVGIQNKVLEALACATPVVTSPQGISALQAEPGRDLWVASTPDEFAAAILRLLADPDLRQSTGLAGRRYVQAHHSWESILDQLENIYQSSASR